MSVLSVMLSAVKSTLETSEVNDNPGTSGSSSLKLMGSSVSKLIEVITPPLISAVNSFV